MEQCVEAQKVENHWSTWCQVRAAGEGLNSPVPFPLSASSLPLPVPSESDIPVAAPTTTPASPRRVGKVEGISQAAKCDSKPTTACISAYHRECCWECRGSQHKDCWEVGSSNSNPQWSSHRFWWVSGAGTGHQTGGVKFFCFLTQRNGIPIENQQCRSSYSFWIYRYLSDCIYML